MLCAPTRNVGPHYSGTFAIVFDFMQSIDQRLWLTFKTTLQFIDALREHRPADLFAVDVVSPFPHFLPSPPLAIPPLANTNAPLRIIKQNYLGNHHTAHIFPYYSLQLTVTQVLPFPV